MKSIIALTLATATLAQPPPHCPQLKYEDGSGGTVSLLQKWKGVVISTPLAEGNVTQADMTASFAYTQSSDTLSANVTYMDKSLTPSSCSAHFEIGCIASTPLDYTFKLVSSDPCFTSGPWKCDAMLTGDDYQKEHHFAFGMEMNYDTSPAAQPLALRGAPLGTFFTGCGGQAWSQRALQYRLQLDK
jgi:hypothetical protein|tara:strand:- start:131 stop:691 length:561 start_codon:yes stop_codon:yes gene_type:complete